MSRDLNPNKARIFRITHRDNVEWILDNGMHCRSSGVIDPNFVQIGNPDLIDKRQYRAVPISPGGTLSDYIPFYFTPYSPMMFNIKTGYGGIQRRQNNEIVMFVTSLHRLEEEGVRFVYSDRHAYLRTAQFAADRADLDCIDWTILQNRDFRRDEDDPGKLERYQAEALVHGHVGVDAMLGIACYDSATKESLEELAGQRGLDINIVNKPSWYF